MAMTPTTGAGIFGPSAAELRQQYVKNLQAQLSSAQSPYERMGIALGNIVGNALGARDPELQRASTIQSIYQSVAQMHPDQTTPEFYRELSSVLSAAGLQEQAAMSAQRANEAQRTRQADLRAERQVALQEERLNLDKRNLDVTLEREKRQGLLTDAQIRQINAQIANMGSNYEYQVIKGPAGETTAIVAINKKNPSDVKQISLGDSAAPTPAPVTASEWDYIPGQGMVKREKGK
jgi:hypothetical protein